MLKIFAANSVLEVLCTAFFTTLKAPLDTEDWIMKLRVKTLKISKCHLLGDIITT